MTSEDTLKGLDAAQNSLPSDPAAAFPPELFLAVLANFSPTELCPLRLVCKAWRALADDPTTWTLLTQKLWEGKVHTERFAALLESDPRAAYAASFVDSKRDLLTAEELCEYDWNWRFKASAGEHFTDGDPWWHGCPSRTRKYYPDGKMGGTIPRPDARWRFVLTSEGRIVDRPGRFVRVAETPAGVISRRTNWGWIIQSCWSVATSFPMPPKGEDPELEDEALQVTTDTQR